jgi:hypothetical protein
MSKKKKHKMSMIEFNRLEKLADDIVNAASQYAVLKELNSLEQPHNDDDIIYKNFLMAILATFEDTSGYEH